MDDDQSDQQAEVVRRYRIQTAFRDHVEVIAQLNQGVSTWRYKNVHATLGQWHWPMPALFGSLCSTTPAETHLHPFPGHRTIPPRILLEYAFNDRIRRWPALRFLQQCKPCHLLPGFLQLRAYNLWKTASTARTRGSFRKCNHPAGDGHYAAIKNEVRGALEHHLEAHCIRW